MDPRPAHPLTPGGRSPDRRFHRGGDRAPGRHPRRERDAGRAGQGRRPPGPHRAPHGGAAPDAARGAAADPPAAGRARRSADHARRGRGPATPHPRGDLAPVAHRGPARRGAHAAGRGAVRARHLRRDAVHGGRPVPAGGRPGAGRGGRRDLACLSGVTGFAGRAGARERRRQDGHAPGDGAGPAAIRIVDRGGPGRAPGGDLGGDAPGGPPPGRAPPPRLRSRRPATDADGGRQGRAGADRPRAREPAGPGCRGAPGDRAQPAAPLPR